jgi:hypothetical protein
MGMDFQPVLCRILSKSSVSAGFLAAVIRGKFGGYNLACHYDTRMLTTVVQPWKRVNETIISMQNFAHLSNGYPEAQCYQSVIEIILS